MYKVHKQSLEETFLIAALIFYVVFTLYVVSMISVKSALKTDTYNLHKELFLQIYVHIIM